MNGEVTTSSSQAVCQWGIEWRKVDDEQFASSLHTAAVLFHKAGGTWGQEGGTPSIFCLSSSQTRPHLSCKQGVETADFNFAYENTTEVQSPLFFMTVPDVKTGQGNKSTTT